MRGRFNLVAGLLIALPLALAWGKDDPGPESNRRNDVYYSEAEARVEIFGDSLGWHDTLIVVDSALRQALYDATGSVEHDSVVHFAYVPGGGGRPVAAYRVVSEMGKHQPFEFLVGLDRRLGVEGVILLTYREARGGDVRRARFLRQFAGKTASDPVSLNRDIIGISGATISSNAVARGVRTTLWLARRIWPEEVKEK